MTATEHLTPERRVRQEMYNYFYERPAVQQLLDRYNHTKQSAGLMGRAIQGVESRVTDAATRAMPLYEYYLQPGVDAVQSVVSKSVENSKRVVDATKSTAVTTTTIGIGAAVVLSQMILSLGLAGTNWMIDNVISVREAGGTAVGRIKETEKLLEERFRNYAGRAQNMAQVPLAKLTEQANTFLDVANKVMDRLLGIESEADPVECTLGGRLHRMVSRFSRVLQNRAVNTVIDPVISQVHAAMEQLNSYMNLVEYVHQRKQWVNEHIEGMHTSFNELKANVEKRANDLMSQPEHILMESVRSTSRNIIENVNLLKDRRAQLVGGNVASKLDSVVSYLEQLEHTFADADNVYELRDEVLTEARAKMTDLLNWTSGLLVRKSSANITETSIVNNTHEGVPPEDEEVKYVGGEEDGEKKLDCNDSRDFSSVQDTEDGINCSSDELSVQSTELA